jgi:hypothetical protein
MDKSSQKSNTTGAVSTRPISFEQQTFIDTKANVWNCSLLSEDDVRNFQHGTHYALYEIMGSRSIEVMGVWGLYFCVWAPNATELSVKGHFNEWRNHEYNLYPRWDKSGIWEGFIPHLGWGETYKYHITGFAGRKLDKGDPFANYWERRPHTASITWNLNYEWQDQAWMQKRKEHNALDANGLGQVLAALRLARARGARGGPPVREVHGGHERAVAAVREGRDDQAGGVPQVLVAVQLHGIHDLGLQVHGVLSNLQL